MSEQSSSTSPTVLAFFDPESSSWRTSQGTFQWEPPESLERLPDWVMWDGQGLYRLPKPERHIVDEGGGALLPLLGTPTRDNAVRSARFRRKNPNMGELAEMLLPTPRAQNGEERNMKPWIRPLDEPQNLENALARLPGIVTNQRSDGGNESSDDRPQTPSPTDGLNPPLWSG